MELTSSLQKSGNRELTINFQSKNKFQVFPWCITSLINLKELDLSGNHIKEIPESFKNLRHLTFLNLRNNRLKEIPDFIWDLESHGMFLKK